MVFRSSFGKFITVLTIAVLSFALILTYLQLGLNAAISSIAPAALIGYSVYLLFWVPRVEVLDQSVLIHNVLRTIEVPFSQIERIDTKWSFTLFTKAGKFSAFGAPAPGRHASLGAVRQDGSHLPETSYVAGTLRPGDLVTSDSGAAASAVRRLWEQNREVSLGEITKTLHTKRLVLLLLLAGAVFISLF